MWLKMMAPIRSTRVFFLCMASLLRRGTNITVIPGCLVLKQVTLPFLYAGLPLSVLGYLYGRRVP